MHWVTGRGQGSQVTWDVEVRRGDGGGKERGEKALGLGQWRKTKRKQVLPCSCIGTSFGWEHRDGEEGEEGP